MNRRFFHWMYLSLFVLLAFGVRFFLLGERSYWYDELLSIDLANYSAKQILLFQTESGDENPPLYFLLLHFWTLLGNDEFTTRLLSLIFNLASLPFIYWLGKELYDKKTAWLAFVFFAFSWLPIRYSQEARPYALFTLLSLVSSLFFLRGLRNSRFTDWLIYLLASLGNLSTHPFALLLWVSQILFFPFAGEGRSKKRFYVFLFFQFCIILFVLLFLSGLYRYILLREGRSPGGYFFLPSVIAGFISGHPSLPLGFISLSVVFPVMVRFFCTVIEKRDKAAFFLVFHLVPSLLILSFLAVQHSLQIRYTFFLYPFFLLLLSRALTELRLKRFRWGVFVLILLLNGIQLTRYFYWIRNDLHSWKKIAFYLEKNAESNDLILVQTVMDYRCLKHYFNKENEIRYIHPSDFSKEAALIVRRGAEKNMWIFYDSSWEDADSKSPFDEWLQHSAVKTDFPNLYLIKKGDA